MNRSVLRRIKRLLLLFVGFVVVVASIIWALGQNMELYWTPSQWHERSVKVGVRVKLGGVVKPGSVHFNTKDSSKVSFSVSDYEQSVSVEYHGLLPALFKEGKGVVVIGVVKDRNTLKARQVLAKHDENYKPPQVGKVGS